MSKQQHAVSLIQGETDWRGMLEEEHGIKHTGYCLKNAVYHRKIYKGQ